MSDAQNATATEEWPLRPWLLAGLLGLAGLLVYLAGAGNGPDTKVPWRAALVALFFFGPLALAFSLERDRWKGPLAFAAIAGAVMAGLAWRAVAAGDAYASPQYGFIAGIIATGLALPLFQSGFHRTRFATPYPLVHGIAWSDAIGAAGSLAFTGASWLLLFVLSELFHLLRIDLLKDLIDEGWFGWTWSGAAFGAALGVLRNEAKIIGTLQRVVMVVMSILAAPLAAGLALFLVAMIVSGPDVLWQATRSATPILLLCAAAAWLLANAIVRDSDDETSRNRLLRAASLVLTLAVFPLTVFAAISLGTRIAQHGLSPERLWGLVAIAVATAYGLAWLVAVVRGGRKGGAWREFFRRANLHLAVVISAVALFLGLPILDFGAISARQQLGRLERGEVSAKNFDYEALRWDFGAAGRRALARLEKSGNGQVAELSAAALARTERVYASFDDTNKTRNDFKLRVQPDDPHLRELVLDYLVANPWACNERCVAIDAGNAHYKAGIRRVVLVQGNDYQIVILAPGSAGITSPKVAPTARNLLPTSRVELRPWLGTRVYVDGKPVGEPFEQP